MPIPLKVLIAEDSPDDAELILLHLSNHGFVPISKRVATSEDMRAALAEGEWDIVLSDHTMPDFGALMALNLCREVDPEIPFIVISGTIGEDVAVAIMRAGANDYLLKDNIKRLGPIIERELRDTEKRREFCRTEQLAAQLASIVNSTDDGIISISLDGTVTTWNLGAERQFGWTAADAIGRHINFLVPRYKTVEFAGILERQSLERVQQYETVRCKKDNTFMDVSITMSPIRDCNGRISGYSKIVRDIGARN